MTAFFAWASIVLPTVIVAAPALRPRTTREGGTR